MNLTTLLPMILKLLPLIPQLQKLMDDPAIKRVLDTILPLVGQLFPGTPQNSQATIDHVKDIQTMLNKAGAAPELDVDGIYGKATQAAARAFQEKAGFTGDDIDGWVGPKTLEALKAATA